jgi:hypothetical protein
MPSIDPKEAGRRGGQAKSARKTASNREHGFKKARACAAPGPCAHARVEQLRRIVNVVPAPSNRKPPTPSPASVPDELAQEVISDDITE